MYCIYIQDKGYYCGRTNAIRHFSSTPRVIDWIDVGAIESIRVVESIAKELAEEYNCDVEIKKLYITKWSVCNPAPRKTFNDLNVGDKFVFNIDIKDGHNSFEYIKLVNNNALCVKSPCDRIYFVQDIKTSSTAFVTLIKENCLENL